MPIPRCAAGSGAALRVLVVLAGMLVAGLPSRVDAQQPEPPPPAAPHYPNLHISGFGDVNFSPVNRRTAPRNFDLGQFVLHVTSQLSSRVTLLGEISFSARSDAGTGSPAAPGFNVEIERMILRFDHSDRLRVSFGRYHTPINYWNTAFHHGQWLQTTIRGRR